MTCAADPFVSCTKRRMEVETLGLGRPFVHEVQDRRGGYQPATVRPEIEPKVQSQPSLAPFRD